MGKVWIGLPLSSSSSSSMPWAPTKKNTATLVGTSGFPSSQMPILCTITWCCGMALYSTCLFYRSRVCGCPVLFLGREQRLVAARIVLDDDFDFTLDTPDDEGTGTGTGTATDTARKRPLKHIGAMDISFVKSSNVACATLVVVQYPSLEVVYEHTIEIVLDLPYISGFLAFRECPAFLQLWATLSSDASCHLLPQVIMMDGNGRGLPPYFICLGSVFQGLEVFTWVMFVIENRNLAPKRLRHREPLWSSCQHSMSGSGQNLFPCRWLDGSASHC